MEQQNEQKLTKSKKRRGWLAAAIGLLFVAICVTVALLASILKNHASDDEDAIALVPTDSVVSESEILEADVSAESEVVQETENLTTDEEIGEGDGASEEDAATEEAVSEDAAEQTGSEEAEEEYIIIDENSLVVQGSSNVPPMEMEVTYKDEVVTVPLHPSVKVYDDVKIWETDTKVDIFKIRYENDEAVVSVEGNGDKVIAPGTDNSYTFYLKNTGDVDLDYTLNLEAYFTPADQHIPVEVKLKGYDGTYLVGSEDTWGDVLELNHVEDKASIYVNRYAYYTLEWQWPYESGDDAFDTYLGNRAVDEDLTLTIGIKTVATGEDSTTEVIKVPILSWIPGVPKTGDGSHVLLWGGLLAVSIVVLIIGLIFKKRREKSSKEMEETNEEN